MNAADMINRCFRHQWPELFGGTEVQVPTDGYILSREEPHTDSPLSESIAEEPMGNGQPRPDLGEGGHWPYGIPPY